MNKVFFLIILSCILANLFGCKTNNSQKENNTPALNTISNNKENNITDYKEIGLSKSVFKIVYNGNNLDKLYVFKDKSDEIYVLLKDFLLIIDCKTTWDNELKEMGFTINNKKYKLKSNDNYANVDGKKVYTNGINLTLGDQMMLPLDFLADISSIKLNKDDKNKILILSSNKMININQGNNIKDEILKVNKEIKLENN